MKRLIEVKEGRVPAVAIKALSAEQRFTYYLLGLIYNETLLLRKLISYSLERHDDLRDFRIEPEFAQTFFLFRIACSKVHEVRQALQVAQVKNELAKLFSSWPEGRSEQRELNRIFSETHWLPKLRKRIGFHYPDFHQWRKLTTLMTEWGDEVIWFGEHATNQFFVGAESMTRAWMFDDATGTSGEHRIEARTAEMVQIVSKTNDFITHVIEQFSLRYFETITIKKLGTMQVPSMRKVSLPFWVSQP